MRRLKYAFTVRIVAFLALICLVFVPATPILALGSPDAKQTTSFGLEGTISAPAPTEAATIATPSNGQVFTDTPITVAGLCKTGLLVKIFSNNVFVGSVVCAGGSYSIKVDLFSGRNDLVARVYDSLDQSGPDSDVISVTFDDAQYAQFGTRVTLTSAYARRGANPGSVLSWPIVLSGGVGPYAVSVDWGDAQGSTLYSESFAGDITVSHTYTTAGVYSIVVKAADGNGTNAYLQLVGVANGEASSKTGASTIPTGTTTGNGFFDKYGPLIIGILFLFMVVTFWLGSRHELYVIRRRIEQSREQA